MKSAPELKVAVVYYVNIIHSCLTKLIENDVFKTDVFFCSILERQNSKFKGRSRGLVQMTA